MKITYKVLSVFTLLALLALVFATPAQAFDERAGETIKIAADEVIEDDLYASANEFTLDGTVQGDLVVFGTIITINGTVEGDLIAAGQTIVINGTVTDDARIAGATLKLGKNAVIGDDVIAGSASLEAEAGSLIEGELVVGAAQALLDGKIDGDVLAGAGALELNGEFGGNVKAEVGDPEEGAPAPNMFIPQSDIEFPAVKPGFNVGENAKIAGSLQYTQSREVEIPSGAVGGKITRAEPVVDPHKVEVKPTPAEAAVDWTLDLLRAIVTWLAFGLLLGWLAPLFMKALMDKVQAQPAASLGWGMISYAAFFFALFLILTVVILGGVFFGILTLGGMSGTIVWVGILALFALVVGFVLVTAFLTKIVAAWLGGRLILSRFKPELAEHKFLPLALGVVIVALLVAIPYIGWLFGLIITFVGLGALWILGRERWQARKTTV